MICFSKVRHYLPASISLLLGALAITSVPANAYDHAGLARDALEHHIRPSYKAFDTSAAGLSAAATAVCDAPSTKGLVRARAAFKDAALSWARIEHVRFGPISDEQRHDRLLYWPDPKGIVRKQVAAVIETADETAFDNRLATKSIVLQGFSALDVVLYGPGSETLETERAKDTPRCRYLTSLTVNIASIARAASAGWSVGGAYEKIWLQPGDGNTTYLTPKETTQALLQAYAVGVELVRDQRLTGQLGLQKVGTKALQPMLPNSGLALAFMQANLEGLRSLLSEGGFIAHQTEPPTTNPKAQGMTALGGIKDELSRAIAAAASAAKMSATPFKDDAAREKLISMGFPLKNAFRTGSQTIAEQASITMGFNALDGD